MAEKTVTVLTEQCFQSEELGVWIDAFAQMEVRADLASRWIDEGKARPVTQAVVETPENATAKPETADLKRKK